MNILRGGSNLVTSGSSLVIGQADCPCCDTCPTGGCVHCGASDGQNERCCYDTRTPMKADFSWEFIDFSSDNSCCDAVQTGSVTAVPISGQRCGFGEAVSGCTEPVELVRGSDEFNGLGGSGHWRIYLTGQLFADSVNELPCSCDFTDELFRLQPTAQCRPNLSQDEYVKVSATFYDNFCCADPNSTVGVDRICYQSPNNYSSACSQRDNVCTASEVC